MELRFSDVAESMRRSLKSLELLIGSQDTIGEQNCNKQIQAHLFLVEDYLQELNALWTELKKDKTFR
jgi:hypothetical protein